MLPDKKEISDKYEIGGYQKMVRSKESKKLHDLRVEVIHETRKKVKRARIDGFQRAVSVEPMAPYLEPIRRTVTVTQAPAEAFDEFVATMRQQVDRLTKLATDLLDLQPATTYHYRLVATNTQDPGLESRLDYITRHAREAQRAGEKPILVNEYSPLPSAEVLRQVRRAEDGDTRDLPPIEQLAGDLLQVVRRRLGDRVVAQAPHEQPDAGDVEASHRPRRVRARFRRAAEAPRGRPARSVAGGCSPSTGRPA